MTEYLMSKLKIYAWSVIGSIISSQTFSQPAIDLNYYLPENASMNRAIPTPEHILGFEIGEWHVSHDQLVYYFYTLAGASSRVTVEKYGRTYENRPLLNVIITSENNHRNLEAIRLNHLKLSDPDAPESPDLADMPLIVRLGYNIHGNEASGGNASLLVAYHLAASNDPQVLSILDKTVILIDPCLNPDGFQRFSTWVNEHRSKNLVADVNNRENDEPWPGGRTNHYWFDLNRDWLLARHPESQGRVALYHKWKPNIQTDHHEMGSNATFFFQPGVASRTHPLIPESNSKLTTKIAAYHAAAFDKNQRLYYDNETFDDFYFGKGSSYPDIHGAIGILFEQASARGHLRETSHGVLSFPFAIKNQFTTSLSTLEAGHELRIDLLEHQRAFFREAAEEGEKDPDRAYVIGANGDTYRAGLLADLLLKHQIRLVKPEQEIKVDSKIFPAASSFVIPLAQPQYRLIKALFEKRKTFQDSIFYDVSTWSMDLSFNLDFATLKRIEFNGSPWDGTFAEKGGCEKPEAYAHAISWEQDRAPALLYQALKKDIRVKVATEAFEDANGNHFCRGSLVVPLGIQELPSGEVFEVLDRYGKLYDVEIKSLTSGASKSGMDLGSNKLLPVEKPRFLLLVGDGVSSSEAGEVWHLLDNNLDIHVSLVENNKLDKINLTSYTTIIMPDGNYRQINTAAKNKMVDWLKAGGSLIAWKGALDWLKQEELAKVEISRHRADSTKKFSYEEAALYRSAQNVSGAILSARLDNTHPVNYGYATDRLPVFKNDERILELNTRNTIHAIVYEENPLLSGYMPKQMVAEVAGTPAIYISDYGSGKIIAFSDNMNFRAIWYGTNRLFINSLFFSKIMNTR